MIKRFPKVSEAVKVEKSLVPFLKRSGTEKDKSENGINILLFYKFVEISDAEDFRERHLEFCKRLGIKGKVLVATEGINGSISGTKEQTEAYKKELTSDERFVDVEFKEESGIFHPFNKMVVKVKNEIIRLDKKLDMNNRGKYISPKEFLEVYEKGEDVLILDARNDYEYDVGRFKGAVKSEIESFREFPKFVKKLEGEKDKKIVMYCTGGIRCEKASAYMIEQGFKDVSQLHGGVIKFCQELPNTVWEGSCFVFDDRLASNVGQKDELNKCLHCSTKCDLMRNCKNERCNKMIFICPTCREEMYNCCSADCVKKTISMLVIKSKSIKTL